MLIILTLPFFKQSEIILDVLIVNGFLLKKDLYFNHSEQHVNVFHIASILLE